MIRPRNRVLPVPGLQALWLALEDVAGGASWLDRSGNGYHAALTFPFAVTGGEQGLACSVGAGKAVVSDVLGFERTDTFSLACGITCTSFSANGRTFLGKNKNSAGFPGYFLWVGNLGAVGIALRNYHGISGILATRNDPIALNTRYSIGFTYGGDSQASSCRQDQLQSPDVSNAGATVPVFPGVEPLE